eukprot:1379355-Amphidinium_carterae.1
MQSAVVHVFAHAMQGRRSHAPRHACPLFEFAPRCFGDHLKRSSGRRVDADCCCQAHTPTSSTSGRVSEALVLALVAMPSSSRKDPGRIKRCLHAVPCWVVWRDDHRLRRPVAEVWHHVRGKDAVNKKSTPS